MSGDDDILFERRGRIALVTLNRPKALNALTLEMCRALETELKTYADDPAVTAVVVQGAGDRAFCAGGDIRRLYDEGKAGGGYPFDFYRDEYRLNALIFHFPKPYVALMDGIVMGGGVGVSVHGSHRLVTERVMFAMPETGIGLFPDVGGSYFLPRCPGRLGLYMAMTGARLKAADALHAGLGDAYVPSDKLDALIDALAEANHADVGQVLDGFREDPGPAPITERQAAIDRFFAADDVEAVLAALDADGGDWAAETAATMRQKSPTSMKIAAEQLRRGASLDFDDCMRMEYRMACGCIAGHDFYEGVRAVVIDKDQAPKWRPDTLEGVSDDDIRAYFETPGRGGDLTFE